MKLGLLDFPAGKLPFDKLLPAEIVDTEVILRCDLCWTYEGNKQLASFFSA
jgi:hypothetical protein